MPVVRGLAGGVVRGHRERSEVHPDAVPLLVAREALALPPAVGEVEGEVELGQLVACGIQPVRASQREAEAERGRERQRETHTSGSTRHTAPLLQKPTPAEALRLTRT